MRVQVLVVIQPPTAIRTADTETLEASYIPFVTQQEAIITLSRRGDVDKNLTKE
jgi:hypothetical protein